MCGRGLSYVWACAEGRRVCGRGLSPRVLLLLLCTQRRGRLRADGVGDALVLKRLLEVVDGILGALQASCAACTQSRWRWGVWGV